MLVIQAQVVWRIWQQTKISQNFGQKWKYFCWVVAWKIIYKGSRKLSALSRMVTWIIWQEFAANGVAGFYRKPSRVSHKSTWVKRGEYSHRWYPPIIWESQKLNLFTLEQEYSIEGLYRKCCCSPHISQKSVVMLLGRPPATTPPRHPAPCHSYVNYITTKHCSELLHCAGETD